MSRGSDRYPKPAINISVFELVCGSLWFGLSALIITVCLVLFSIAVGASYQPGMLIDIVACAENEIRGNLLSVHRDSPKGQKQIIGIRNRQGEMVGCDTPQGYARWGAPAEQITAYGFWDAEYWENRAGEIVFPTRITGNTFNVSGKYAHTLTAIQMSGTVPAAVEKSFSPTCIQPAPAGWYERARVYATANVFINGDPERRYESEQVQHDPRCIHAAPDPMPQQPENMIEVQ